MALRRALEAAGVPIIGASRDVIDKEYQIMRDTSIAVLLIDEIDKADPDLPNAFLRRCLVHTLTLPDDLAPWLIGMGELHLRRLGLARRCFPKTLALVAEQLLEDRVAAHGEQGYAPGLAEYLDLFIALARLGDDQPAQEQLLGKIAGFALRKEAGWR